MSSKLLGPVAALLILLPSPGRAEETNPTKPSAPAPAAPAASAATSAPVLLALTNAVALVPPSGGWLLPDDAEKAYDELDKANRVPPAPAEWNTTPPTEEQRKEFRKSLSVAAGQAADKAKEFALRFPSHRNAKFANSIHRELLKAAIQLGAENRIAELEALGPEEANPVLSPAPSAFQLKMQAAVAKAQSMQSKGLEGVLDTFEAELRLIRKEYPDEQAVYSAMMEIVRLGTPKRARPLVEEILQATNAHPVLRLQAKMAKSRFERLDKPFDLEFTALDGRKVKVSDLRGKVVLLDFWATWCPPCVASVPELIALHKRLQPQGLEIVGISADEDQGELKSFVKRAGMSWPQYFDPAGRESRMLEDLGIVQYPTMWLVDRKGILRDLDAHPDTAKKIEALLAEK
jgi:thiol-disulfide isomerase/thioredoxin